MYDKLACWCKVNGEGKDTAVEIAEAKVSDLSSRIKALTAKSSELEESIKKVESEVAANMQALDTATSMREEALAKFRDEEKDMIVSITSLKNALVVLEKNLDTSFLQMSTTLKQRVRDVVNKAKADDILNQILNPAEANTLTAFMQGIAAAEQMAKEKTALLGKTKVQLAEAKEDLQD